MKNKTSPSNLGAVVSVRGSFVDIRFDEHLPLTRFPFNKPEKAINHLFIQSLFVCEYLWPSPSHKIAPEFLTCQLTPDISEGGTFHSIITPIAVFSERSMLLA